MRSPLPYLMPAPGAPPARSWRWLAAGLALFAAAAPALADANVRTLGGGRLTPNSSDAGFVDGDTLQLSQFNTPLGAAVDSAGRVFVADRDNGAIRRLDVSGNRSTTLVTGLNKPVAVAITGANELYYLTQGDGRLTRVDRFGNTTLVATGLQSPTAMTVDVKTNFFVTELRGTIVSVNLANGSSRVIASGLNQPAGIAALESGLLAVSDTGNHQIRFVNPESGSTVLRIGTGVAGFRDGAGGAAQFNQPQQLARTPAGTVVVADRLNHRVRLVDLQGVVSTVYGVAPQNWEGPECLECNPIILPGWLDGSDFEAEAREPLGVTVSNEGKLYATEGFYHIIREVTGASGLSAGIGTGNTNLVVLAPTMSPQSGYFPMGQVITVTNPNSSTFFPTGVYYTTDGSEPTTNSLRVVMTGSSGTIFWRETLKDLSSLRLRAFVGSEGSAVVRGLPAEKNEIGVPRDVSAGSGSTVLLPVVVNLRPSDPLQSLQFRVEVTPTTPGAPVIPDTFDALSISTNDFISVVTSDRTDGRTSFNLAGYTFGDTRGLVITMIGTNSNLSVSQFGVVAMLAVPIPPAARKGDTYQVDLVRPSGTRDGGQQSISLAPQASRFIRVEPVTYEVGDTAPAYWYNADSAGLGFGDGALDNADVNNVFTASLGVHVPYPFSDLFDAMDTYPVDTQDAAGGDGLIRFLDWQIVLLRSLGLDPERWTRTWTEGGVRVARPNSSRNQGLRSTPALAAMAPAPGTVWTPQARLAAAPLEGVGPGATVEVPVSVTVAPGQSLSGLAFRLAVQAEGNAPAITQPVQFIPAPGIAAPIQTPGNSPAETLCGWSMVPSPAFAPALSGTRTLGTLRVTIPPFAPASAVYTMHFFNADGAANLQTPLDFETFPASIWISSAARSPQTKISDEWKVRFFGKVDSDAALESADPDGDGVSNLVEFEAGTNPADRASRLALSAPAWDSQRGVLAVRWLSAPGKFYTLEGSSSPAGPWTVLTSNVAGDGHTKQWTTPETSLQARFYRLRVQP